ncbi:hypothetical protein [Streptomyces noursei]|uniref:hypothetical protein n=1 Tax=Streptomyces noursei TaxID=1971 RepID=UPI0016744D38|nr:hypothetical protein [Streptomyces noursei]MCZ1020690.1 hypothetical protein [Streptomyces noursei]GGX38005.1 hypothetical protein GCM10010341_70050 [Streptomyces noursei]
MNVPTLAKGFARFWYAFVIGDDWRIAASVVAVLVVGTVALLAGAAPGGVLAALLALLLMAGFAGALLLDVRHRGRS